MTVRPKQLVAGLAGLFLLVCTLLTTAAGVQTATSEGSTRIAWACVFIAGAATVVAVMGGGLVALPAVRRWVRRVRVQRRQTDRVAADVAKVKSELDSVARRRIVRGVEEKVTDVVNRLDALEGSVARLPDTARLHKLLDVTAKHNASALEAVNARLAAAHGEISSLREALEVARNERAAVARELRQAHQKTLRATERQGKVLYGQLDGLAAIYSTLHPTTGLPPLLADWAIGADFAAHLVRHVLRQRPECMVELGSGVSTVLLAMAARQAGAGRVWSIEHDPAYAERTNEMLELYDVAAWATVHLAPLRPIDVAGQTYEWYDLSGTPLPERVDLLLVDGPPGSVGPQARFPAVPRLADRLGPGSVVYLDDSAREDEAAVVERWCTEFGMQIGRHLGFAKGVVELVPASAE